MPVLRGAIKLEVLSLDPAKFDEKGKEPEFFQGYRVMGRIEIPKSERFDALRDSLIAGVAPASMLRCFSPRHGVRVVTKKRTMDLVMCFECGRTVVVGLPEQDPPLSVDFINSDLLNKILDEAGIPRDLSKMFK